MSSSDWFFIPDTHTDHLRVPSSSDAIIQHEIFYESEVNTISQRPLFLGRSYGKKRFLIALSIIALCVVGLFTRAFWMQIIQRHQYQALAENNRLRHTPLWPRRGVIRDRNGTVLADSVPRFEATLTPQNLPPSSETVDMEMGEVARLLGLSINDLKPSVYATGTIRDEETIIADNIPYVQAMAYAVALPHLPGFDLQVGAKRQYPWSAEIESLSHVLGYVGKLSPEEYTAQRQNGYQKSNEIGKTGVEKTYEKDLRGIPGERVSEVDARGNVRSIVGDQTPTNGKDLYLSLDLDLQREAEDALRDEMQQAHLKRGAVVAMDPRDGSLLALVSWPAFDNNAFSGGVSSTVYQRLIQDPDQPLYPRAWAGTYPSGSTVKIVISLAALAEKVITPSTSVLSAGGLQVGGHFFPDWKAGGHGITNVRKAIAWSVNTFFYTIGGGYESFIGLGVDRLTDWMRRFGLSMKSGIDLPGEGTGLVPSKDWKQKTKNEPWYVGDTYNLSIGQGDLLVTPLQVANYTAAIANGGKKLTPHLVMSEGTVTSTLAFVSSSISGVEADDIKVVQDGMRDCVVFGSCRGMNLLPFPVAGKTGTAQWNANKPTHAWFTSFAPFDHPEIVVTVLLEEGGEGSSASVPVARRVMQTWWELRQQRGGTF